jgi:hypothetical protein
MAGNISEDVITLLEINQSMSNLGAKIDLLGNGISGIKEDIDGMADDISKIKEAMYNPDKGLYARQAMLEARIQQLESWKAGNTKVVWAIVSLTIALVMNSVWGMIVSG